MMKKKITDLLVITSYPRKSKVHGEGTVGIASYTKNTLLALLAAGKIKKKDLKIVVLAEQLNDQPETHYHENGIEIKRIWKRNSITSFLSLLLTILSNGGTKKILIEFEHAMFGGYLYLSIFPLFLFILRLLRKEIIIVAHQVIDDINDMSGHVGLRQTSMETDLINLLIKIFYNVTFINASKIIVFEDYLKGKLGKFTSKRKIVVIPHSVEEFNDIITREDARKKLGIKDEFVMLYFGFIAWYKGADWLVEKIQNSEYKIQNKTIKLIIAGGANPNHVDKSFYRDYIDKIEKISRNSHGRIIVTGFVPEEEIPSYFQACDVVVLPYRTLMSSSGPLSLALSFGKPFLVSDAMGAITYTKDFSHVMKKYKVKIEDISFHFLNNSLNVKINKLMTDKQYLVKLTDFSKFLKGKRDFHIIGEKYYQEIFHD